MHVSTNILCLSLWFLSQIAIERGTQKPARVLWARTGLFRFANSKAKIMVLPR